MSDRDGPKPGSVVWSDLTVADAEGIRDFYQAVVGWDVETVDMDGYEDYSMVVPATGAQVVGVCHARGINADLPPQWLAYVIVADLDASIARCVELGGEVAVAPRGLGGGRFCVIRDPAGAVMALFEVAAGE